MPGSIWTAGSMKAPMLVSSPSTYLLLLCSVQLVVCCRVFLVTYASSFAYSAHISILVMVLLNYCLSHMGTPACLTELQFPPCENISEAEKVIAKIFALPIGERLWPNCLNRPFRNASFVDVAEFVKKMNKALVKHSTSSPEKVISQGAAARTRGKLNARFSTNPPLSVLSVSSDSGIGPKGAGDAELNSGLLYADGTHYLFNLLVYFDSKLSQTVLYTSLFIT